MSLADRVAPLHGGIDPAQITGVVLAGGRGTRMGGLDKGLELFNGVPLALHALRRLQLQVGSCMLNANRNLEQYNGFGVSVCQDSRGDFAGPLAGIASALHHCRTPYLVTVPCDTPFFPGDLVQTLSRALTREGAKLAVACTPDANAQGSSAWRIQPVFCLLRTELLESLEQFLERGGARVETWTSLHAWAVAKFDSPEAFLNVNTSAQLRALEP